MHYKSTRDITLKASVSEAIVAGISADGGLFVPSELPKINLNGLQSMSYPERAAEVFKLFMDGFSDAKIHDCCKNAYNSNFETETPAIVKSLSENVSVLELWHGPTCAFKDMALQILPFFMRESVKKVGLDKKIVILTATSGDTGKAALEGFADVAGIEIMVFYPESGVSDVQKRQMQTQEGKNVRVCGVEGNFDDCQSAVKKIFTDVLIKEVLAQKKLMFSSANSINWGRLMPQIAYYVSAYADLVTNGKIKHGDKINIAVPTGNFGNILAAYYAKEMGLPVNMLICASNINNILTDFIKTGIYDLNREFYTTASPSMDILISSNLERLVFHLGGEKSVDKLYNDLTTKGKYEVSTDVKTKLKQEFYGGFADDSGMCRAICNAWEKYGYVMDTHTAVGMSVYADYAGKTGDTTYTLLASTASPYKFSGDVARALKIDVKTGETTDTALQKLTGLPIPKALKDTETKAILHKDTVSKDGITSYVLKSLEKFV
jgi:threonine synthase